MSVRAGCSGAQSLELSNSLYICNVELSDVCKIQGVLIYFPDHSSFFALKGRISVMHRGTIPETL